MDNRLRAVLVLLTGLMILDREGLLDDDASLLGWEAMPFDSPWGDSDRSDETEDEPGDPLPDAMIPSR